VSVIAYSGNTTDLKSHYQQCCASKKSSSSSDIQNYFKVCTSKLSVTGGRSKKLTKGLMTSNDIRYLKPISIVEGEGFHIRYIRCNISIPKKIRQSILYLVLFLLFTFLVL